MLNTPASWEAMEDAEADRRVARLRLSANLLQNVYDAFTPWQHVSTGVAALDALLSEARVCSGGSSADPSAEVSQESPGCRNNGGAGGLPVGGVHEFYGPPNAGKSMLLRRLASTFTRRMTGFRQWCLDELLRDQTWVLTPLTDGPDGDEPPERKEVSAAAPLDAWHVPTAAIYAWDLYVCLIRGTSSLSKDPTLPSLSAEVVSWQELLLAVFPSPPSTLSSNREGVTEGNAQHSGRNWQQSPSPPSQRQQLRDYVVDHCHVHVVSTPNELLAYLDRLQRHTGDGEVSSGQSSAPQPSTSWPPPAHQQSRPIVASSETERLATTDAGSAISPAGEQKQVARKRSRSSDTSGNRDCGEAEDTPATAARSWRLQRQRLLLIDGLDQLWLHPSFGTHSGTHTGQWFAVELQRLLRCFVTPHCVAQESADALGKPREPTLSVYSTAVVVNGCQGGSYSLQMPSQLQERLRSCAAPSPAAPWRTPMPCTLPRPAGNPVWVMGVDTRCLVESAHPGLTSLASSGPPVPRTQNDTSETTQTPSVSRKRAGVASGPQRTTFLSSSGAAWRRDRRVAVESHVTVVQGGACICASWVERCGDDA